MWKFPFSYRRAQLFLQYNTYVEHKRKGRPYGLSTNRKKKRPPHQRCRQPLLYKFGSHSRISIEASVNGDGRSRDEAGIAFIAKEQKRTLKLLGLAEALHRRCGKNFSGSCGGRSVLVPEQGLVLVC